MVRTRVEICGINTSELPLLTADVMKETFIRLQSGDEFARDELVFANLRLVLSLVQRFNYRGEQADDLFQVGCIGLLKAIDNFDLKHNVRFSTYAVPMIIGEIKRHLRDHHAVRVSRSLRDIAYKAIRAKEQYVNEHQHEPRISDLEKITGIPEEDILFALDAIQDPMSLHEPMNSDGGDPIYMMDQLHDQRVSEDRWMNYVSIKDKMGELDERQQLIVSKRFYLGQTQTEIAKELGISQAQISRIEKHAMEQIRLGIEQKK
ncbi:MULTISPECIES: RNA polymerase sporulation sigma factor SigG [unclassified Sporosarcina]|uniref:RNA polymerase sporulation sigma factor SigG n=1 Tax=unclassified Sporosarcina TaxID=2647733 RepID=UPI000C16EBA5|nr:MULTISPECIES: RNA polymerase sporulation sigma factor SigG [unclassified Sporosarcina]PIC86484.1 RNA polymerase sporulation sigma factor SigG [Sporosarcina sp. P20a]PID00094.1 RNA polymerase sporulation sigma factor SigG [Sporosarcina sp. P29]PID06776.1 RNA polymerase sporulation sigma factor SigG [Sporosarcina sp. P30]PID09971.1 RNA polymerase sporulation sigma factor SigG [Sporosarcina sp. P31]PID13550.1 RNA polymerase sporulation sigma factor SigG [Sporosarcina sp. P32b]